MSLLSLFSRDKPNGHDPAPVNEQAVVEALRGQQAKARVRLMESLTELLANYVDPDDAFLDNQGKRWQAVGAGTEKRATRIDSEEGLRDIRNLCRDLAITNEFAINGHENRVSYVVGTGHSYEVSAKAGQEVSDEGLASVQQVIDEFIKDSGWHSRQQETWQRLDRDGEAFLRFFADPQGEVRIRYIEPGEVYRPKSRDRHEHESFGVITEPDDVETVLGYWVNGEMIDAKDIQHRKLGVDSNVKRGLPLFWPVRKNLMRAEKILRNMGVAAEIQTAFALIRKHGLGAGDSGGAITAWMQGEADNSVTRNAETKYFRHYGPGSIVDVPAGQEYDFPSQGLDASRYVAVLQAELRAIASRLVMPEFMLSSDASNANYSSTMVAEGPAVKFFERLQQGMIQDDLEVLDRVLDAKVEAGVLDQGLRDSIEIDVTPPGLTSRDRLQETQADKILVDGNAMSIETWQLRNDLDPDHETPLIDEQREKMDPFAGMNPLELAKGFSDQEKGPNKGEKPDEDKGTTGED